MTESDWKAEILDDQITSLAPPGSTPAPVDYRWRLVAIGAAVAFAVSVILLYPPHSANVAPVSATPSASPVTAVTAPSAAPSPTPSPTPDEGPCRTDRVQIDPPAVPSSATWPGLALVPAGDLAAFVADEGENRGSIVVVGLADVDTHPQVVATYRTDHPARGGVYAGPVGWSSSGSTLLVRADQYGGPEGEAPGCANLFLVNADGSGVTALTDFGPGTSIYDAALAPNSGLIAYSTDGELRVIDPPSGARHVADCGTAWQLRWSPDEQKFLGICNEVELLVVDVPNRTAVRATLPDRLTILAAIWGEDGTSITVVATSFEGPQNPPLTVLDFSAATLRFAPRTSFPVPASLGFATISPSGRWIVLQDTQDGTSSAVLDVATGVTTTLPRPPAAEDYSGVPFAWEADGDTGLYAAGGLLYAVNLATATATEVGIMPGYWFVWGHLAAP